MGHPRNRESWIFILRSLGSRGGKVDVLKCAFYQAAVLFDVGFQVVYGFDFCHDSYPPMFF
jgi:hypothetical protein